LSFIIETVAFMISADRIKFLTEIKMRQQKQMY